MLNNISLELEEHPSSYANWLSLYTNYTFPFYEVASTGNEALVKATEINKNYIPNKLLCGSLTNSNLPLLKGRYSTDNTIIFICVNKTCNLPTDNVNIALQQIE